ncbi:MAG: hypothetical protein VKK80_06885 [Prochlorothrix sp.]|nr:hypothetical protein [Prochlorothrix sp.]
MVDFPASRSVPPTHLGQPDRRNLSKVPFVELYNGRLQGVISSGSDLERVYLAYFQKSSLDFHCSTNNNRPCGGVSQNNPCKHLRSLLQEAIVQYGGDAVARALGLEAGTVLESRDVLAHRGQLNRQAEPEIFSRFLAHLQYLQLEPTTADVPEMAWW